MKNKVNDFPQYRKLSSRKVYYKITSLSTFVEVQFIGEKKVEYNFTASKFPEKIRIQEMLDCIEPFEKSSEATFTSL